MARCDPKTTREHLQPSPRWGFNAIGAVLYYRTTAHSAPPGGPRSQSIRRADSLSEVMRRPGDILLADKMSKRRNNKVISVHFYIDFSWESAGNQLGVSWESGGSASALRPNDARPRKRDQQAFNEKRLKCKMSQHTGQTLRRHNPNALWNLAKSVYLKRPAVERVVQFMRQLMQLDSSTR
ncbi:hypothetical protein PABG_07297 [Paracoccidioides brasiliensis Pb03]|nr:hypothetical protein PABG_07297 [Paracoccidioides brasiliensis Pb03]